jgi:hypothetical protein
MRSDQSRTSHDLSTALASGIPAQAEPRGPTHRHGDYHRARAAEDDHAQRERAQAARTVAGNALDSQDCSLLLSILGLDGSAGAEDGTGDLDRRTHRR